MTRPDYVRCVGNGYSGEHPRAGKTWCGKTEASVFTFTDAAHALCAARNGDRLLICPECADAMSDALRMGRVTYGCGTCRGERHVHGLPCPQCMRPGD